MNAIDNFFTLLIFGWILFALFWAIRIIRIYTQKPNQRHHANDFQATNKDPENNSSTGF